MNDTIELISKTIEDIADIPINEIREDSLIIDDLNLSSLEIMSVIAKIEQKKSIKISESELLSIRTVGNLADIINSKIKFV